ncbi:cation transporting ATPase [Beggiatoa sp. PS]|nr:cation transporting ATPase [Beggiatoa sp. PS]
MIQKANSQRDLETDINHNLTISSVSLAFASVASLFYPPLFFASIFGVIYTTIPIWKSGYQSLVKKHKFTMAVLDSIIFPGLLLTGHYFIAALLNWLCYLSQKLVFKLKSREHTRASLSHVLAELPTKVWFIKEDMEVEMPVDALTAGDLILMKAGETIPVDGIITEGIALIDQHILTGEHYVREKSIGDQVLASTIVLSGQIYIQVQQTGIETVVAKLTKILDHQADSKNSMPLRGENLADKTVLPTLAISALALPLFGAGRALAVLYSYMGSDIRIITPISTLNYIKIADQKGILIKDGRGLERLSQVNVIVFDKNSTLTQEKPKIVKIHTFNCIHVNQLLYYAAIAKFKQTHPIAKAIVQEAYRRGLNLPTISDSQYEIIGHGTKMTFSHHCIRVGSSRFIKREGIVIPEEIKTLVSHSQKHGYFIVLVAIDYKIAGIIELHSSIHPEAKQIIEGLQKRDLSLYLMSEEPERLTQQFAEQLGIENYVAETSIEDKVHLIEKLQAEGKKVCFIGDGINDSLALKQADVSISLHDASAIATDTAQIIIKGHNLEPLLQLFELSDELNRNLNRGVLMIVVPGLITIGGVFIRHVGLLASVVLNNFGLLGGVSNSMLPLLKHQEPKKNQPEQPTEQPIQPTQPNQPSGLLLLLSPPKPAKKKNNFLTKLRFGLLLL